jgi:dTDP-4-amino-4,6-dideoxygalactose transaminase
MTIKHHYLFDYSKKEILNVKKVFLKKKFADGKFQNKCDVYLKKTLKSKYIAVTQSCAAALEVSAKLLNLHDYDEILLPSFTFSATLTSFFQKKIKPIFVDIEKDSLCMCPFDAEKKITNKTKAIYLVHYGSNFCDMKKFMILRKKYNILIIEDAAHSIFGLLNNKYIGTIGDIGNFSFHETKNFSSGQGGAISINNKNLIKKAELILNKGNDLNNLIKDNFSYFNLVSIGSEYRLAEIPSAMLYGQLIRHKKIIKKREKVFNFYKDICTNKIYKNYFYFIDIKKNSISNYHNCTIIFKSKNVAKNFMIYMKKNKINVATHYYPLHISKFARQFNNIKLNNTEFIFNRLIRLPLHTNITKNNLNYFKYHFLNFFKKLN